jgi:TolB-like protein
VRHAIGDTGDEQRFIKTLPRKGVRFVGVVREDEETTPIAATSIIIEPSRAVLTIPNKPSIAVLPFTNMSGDPDQQYFADGMVEEIITALSRIRWLFVIARNSSFAYKGKTVDVKQIGHELGVRYILEGSVRKDGSRVRISGQLINASTGAHLWAERFDGALEDIFDLQDQVTASVTGAILPRLEEAEIERVKHKPTENLDAYDHLLRGMAIYHQWTKKANAEALLSFSRAIEIDPNFATAYALAARCYAQRKANGWRTDAGQETAEAMRLARRAVELGKNDATALCFAGWTIARVGDDHHTGAALIDRALALNPNLAVAWYCSGWTRVCLGEPETAVKHCAHAMRLSPFDPLLSRLQAATAMGHLLLGHYDEAAAWAEKSLQEQPMYLAALQAAAASHALAGRIRESQHMMARLRKVDPVLRMSNVGSRLGFRRPDHVARVSEGLRAAGLPK